ncbi:hypothetical protein [Shewanella sp.]|uniref:hypothetical protein n=1 Tax=Shewanella sp. TaxID=50422 RepID=UPI00356B0F57
MLNVIKRGWKAYTDWCDSMGLTPENRRSCAPRLQDPPLKRGSQSQTEGEGATAFSRKER